jgi:hypothetical protein
MSISIIYKNGEYHWELYDGPDGIDYFSGKANSLGEAFENILKERIINSIRYN